MKVCIIGATGYVGEALALHLAQKGIQINALCRTPAKAKSLQHPNIQLISGDLSDPESLKKAMEGCQQVYHLAAFATVWHKTPSIFYDINVQGTKNVLEAAKYHKVEKIVVTSTAGVMGASPHKDSVVAENTNKEVKLSTEYEKTKLQSEQVCLSYAQEGMHVVIVNPSRIYGPGQMSESNAATKLIVQYYKGKWRFLPGDGKSMGNYVFIDDVIQGHLLAMEKGKSGERYILGGENVSFIQFFDQLKPLVPQPKKLYKVPLALMLGFAKFQLFLADNFSIKPLITPPFVRKYTFHWNLTSQKAIDELGYQITPLREGFAKTIEWLKTQNPAD